MNLYVCKGTLNEGDPEIQDNTVLRNGAVIHDMPLYRVKLDGVNIIAVEQMWRFAQSSDLMVGDIIPTARNTPSSGFLLCDGLSVSEIIYHRLFEAIGYAFTPSEEQDTGMFRVPDMRDESTIALNWQIKYNPEALNPEGPMEILDELEVIQESVNDLVISDDVIALYELYF